MAFLVTNPQFLDEVSIKAHPHKKKLFLFFYMYSVYVNLHVEWLFHDTEMFCSVYHLMERLYTG